MVESMRNFCEGVYFRRWFGLKRCSSHSKWPTVWTFIFLQILLAGRLIRELILSYCKLVLVAKLQNFVSVLKLPLTALGYYDKNIRLFSYLNITNSFHMSWKY